MRVAPLTQKCHLTQAALKVAYESPWQSMSVIQVETPWQLLIISLVGIYIKSYHVGIVVFFMPNSQTSWYHFKTASSAPSASRAICLLPGLLIVPGFMQSQDSSSPKLANERDAPKKCELLELPFHVTFHLKSLRFIFKKSESHGFFSHHSPHENFPGRFVLGILGAATPLAKPVWDQRLSTGRCFGGQRWLIWLPSGKHTKSY